ncbi:hypothetical protein CF319_g2851 [Tilletia indica]|nr:hypothetical protein CF319_g2851 [Tilletia indica]
MVDHGGGTSADSSARTAKGSGGHRSLADGDLGLLAMDAPPTPTQATATATATPTAASRAAPAPSPPTTSTLHLTKRQRLLLQRWLLAVGCVTFDLDKGPELEFLAPSLDLTPEEKDNIAFSSFPDTAIFDSGNAVFSWRMRTGQLPLPAQSSMSAPSSAPKRSSSSPQKGDNRRFSATSSKRRHLFGSSNPASQSSNDSPFSSSSASGTTSITSSGTAIPHPSQSVTRTHSVALCPPPNTNHKLSGASSHGAMHALFKSSDKDRDREKESGRGHFREFVSMLSRSSQQQSSSPNGGTGGSQTTSSEPTSPFENEDGGPVPIATGDDHTPSSVDSTLSSAAVPAALPYIYGHVFFQQRPDPSIRRGYFQKSFVLISHLPLLGLWSRVVEIVGQSMFRALRKAPSINGQQGVGAGALSSSDWRGAEEVLRMFVDNVAQWPTPGFEDVLELRVLEQSFRIDLSSSRSDQRHQETEPRNIEGSSKGTVSSVAGHANKNGAANANVRQGIGALGEGTKDVLDAVSPRVALSETFKGDIFADLWLLWECLLIGEPIVVLGPEPCAASTSVWLLKSLIQPLQLGVDWRPYFHLNDRDFSNIVPATAISASASHHEEEPTAGNHPPPAKMGLLGVSNPFFTQCASCTDWTLLRVDGCSDAKIERPSAEVARMLLPASSSMTSSSSSYTNGKHGGGAPGGEGGWGVGKGNKVGHSGGAAPAQYAPGLSSRRKRRVSRDRGLMKVLLDLSKEGRDTEASTLIRAHFVDLTRKFLAPLDGFFAKLVAQRTMGPSVADSSGAIPAFDQQAFLTFLKASGSPLPIKSRGMNLPSLGVTSGSSSGSGPANGGISNHHHHHLHLHLHLHHHHAGTSNLSSAPSSATSSSSPSSSSSSPANVTPASVGGSSTTRASLYLDFIRGPNFGLWWTGKWREVEWERSTFLLEEALKVVVVEKKDSADMDRRRLEETLALSEKMLSVDVGPHTFGGEKWFQPTYEREEEMNGGLSGGGLSMQGGREREQQLSLDEDLGMGMMRQGSKISTSSSAISKSNNLDVGVGSKNTPLVFPPPSTGLPTRTDNTHHVLSAGAEGSNGSGSVMDSAALVGLYLSCADERSQGVLRRLVEVQRRARNVLGQQ